MGITIDPNDPELNVVDPENGQRMAYLVLSKEERLKGFVQPVRRSYIHSKCGTVTYMSQDIAETYARDPRYYGATYCASCRNHFPVGVDGEFVWDGTDIKVGTTPDQ